jgi:hypothetical protein|tara:strand:+ start:972 stop:1226 length:255 start_codon:yes stop_codon:yes gene_type:complete
MNAQLAILVAIVLVVKLLYLDLVKRVITVRQELLMLVSSLAFKEHIPLPQVLQLHMSVLTQLLGIMRQQDHLCKRHVRLANIVQ